MLRIQFRIPNLIRIRIGMLNQVPSLSRILILVPIRIPIVVFRSMSTDSDYDSDLDSESEHHDVL